ncbi:unnamed protein product [marine sediment metagenome]|uniref:Uncharacterized protein n=1 Tax=marine sediment metagenome TaxID=412755 RepID=X1FEE8_9ZZZZ
MCLARVWTDEEMEEWLAGQGEVVEVWKVVHQEQQRYYSPLYVPVKAYKAGLNNIAKREKITATCDSQYYAGFHFFLLNEKTHSNFRNCFLTKSPAVIKCLLKKDWITAMGDSGYLGESGILTSVVALRAVFPHHPETEARYEDLPQESQEAMARMSKGDSK